jgi:hypothetical protein
MDNTDEINEINETAKCDSCDKTYLVSELDECRDLWSRVEAGNEVPAGDCPDCGAFCYLIKPERPIGVVVVIDRGVVRDALSSVPGGFIVTDHDGTICLKDGEYIMKVPGRSGDSETVLCYSGKISIEPQRLDKIFELFDKTVNDSNDGSK